MTSKSSISVNLQYYMFLSILKFFAHLPSRVYSSIAEVVYTVFRSAFKKDLKKIATNVKAVFGLEAHSNFVKVFQRQVLVHQIVSNLEVIRSLANRKSKVEILDIEVLKRNLESIDTSNGVVCITGHLGSWELCAQSVAEATNKTFYALAKPPKNKAIVKLLAYLRANMTTELLWTDRKDLFSAMKDVLDQGECLGFVMDQKPGKRKGVKVDFLGQNTEYVSGPAKFAILKNAPVVSVFCVREGPMRYRIISNILLEKGHDIESETEVTQIMAKEIESAIKLYPEQWVWNYKRWKLSY